MEYMIAIRGLLAAGGPLGGPRAGQIVIALAVAGLAIFAGVLVFWIHNRWERKRRTWDEFRHNAEQRGLGPEEQNLASRIAKLAQVRDPGSIFTVEAAFNRGLAALAEDTWAGRRTGKGAHNVCGTCVFLTSLREKLGFQIPPGQEKRTTIRLGRITEGTRLSVLRQRSPENLEVTVAGQRNSNSELLVSPQTPLRPHIGESWVLRYPQGGSLWEFDAWVTGKSNGHLVLRPAGTVRWINRRRFARHTTRKSAFVAPFPFVRAGREMAPPQFSPATVSEIGGPGLKLEAPVQVQAGDEVLVVLKLRPGHVMEGLGVARRAQPGGEGNTSVAVELVSLNTAEVGELIRESNLAARLGGGAPSTANAAGTARTGLAHSYAGTNAAGPQAMNHRAGQEGRASNARI